ncbi:MAG TPA: MBL fold metallo-hydrolase [Ornithinimicrobium sp.]|uniref:MBL fold metallo-hydrolase n=1 Tax=Ornithinimicrobium sp. TaxID=1977084 RepID=UPI002B4A0BCD|nr:MBL fold metallo-hydrolase [Ornithinimicrobium sp.]HKJ12173.1 MBL fold metallo-hydrolase [Ornithinimicrobium sp.]
MSRERWHEVGPAVLVRRHAELDLNCGLVVGEQRALVVDTNSTTARGAELAAAVREVTRLEPVVVNTHAHYDHCFGNAAFRDSQIYGHVGAADGLRSTAEHQRAQAIAHLQSVDRAQEAVDLEQTEVVLPFYLIDSDTAVDLGGRTVHLLFGGRAHTDHDLAVAVPDAGVTFWGDMLEHGADPAMEDSYPLEWAASMHELSRREQVREGTVAVPGHGDVVDPAFVSAQVEQLGHLATCLTERLLHRGRELDGLVECARGLGLQEETLRAAAMRALETAATG